MKGSNGAFSFAIRFGIVLALAIGLAVPAGAQVQFGVLTGTVTDPTGAVIPGAEVTITNLGTGSAQTITTNAAGVYRAGQLLVGQYKIEAAAPGFKTGELTNVTVNLGAIARHDFQLEVGAATEVVTVEAGATLISTEDSRLATQVVGRQIQDLPLNGRNVYDLIQLAPGAVNVAGVSFENGENTVVNGLRPNFNGFLINGSSNKGLSGGSQTLVNPDLVAEFQMLTLNMSAQYGNSAASITNLVTKSGTNDFHGSLFYFFRDESLDATEFFRNQSNVTKAPLKFNQFGASVTGPIIKDKVFFTASYQGSRFETQAPAEPVVQESAAWRQAIASALPNSTAAFLYNSFPTSTTGAAFQTLADFVASGNSGSGFTTFAEYMCPDNLGGGTDPGAAAALAAQFQSMFGVLATDDFSTCSVTPGLQLGSISRTVPFLETSVLVFNTQGRLAEQSVGDLVDGDDWSTRIDWAGQKNRIFGEFYWQLSKDSFGPSNPNQSAPRGFTNPAELFEPNFQFSWVSTIRPTVVNELRVGYSRSRNEVDTSLPGVPDIAFDDGSMGLGSYNGYPQFFNENIYTYSDMVSVTKGSHNLKFGVEYRDNRENSEFNVARPSLYFFDPLFFAADAPYEQVAGVDPGIISGQPAQLATNNRAWFNFEVGVFFQDDWKVSPKLTLNLGLRYDYYDRHKERFGRQTTFIPAPGVDELAGIANANIPAGQPGCSTATGQDEGLAPIAGICGPGGFAVTDRLGAQDRDNFGPRVGVAYDPFGTGKTVIRAGFGISFEGTLYNPLSNSRWNLPFYSFNIVDNFLLDDVGNIVYGPPAGESPRFDGPATNLGQGVGAQATGNLTGWDPSNSNLAFLTGIVFPEGIDDPWVMNWHVGFQREIIADTVLEVNYVGTQGRNLFRAQQFNRRRGVRLDPALVGPTFTTAQGDTLVTGSTAGSAGRFLNPNYGRLRVWKNTTRSWYHSLQLSVRKAMSHGVMFNGNYTWSHSIDTGSGWHSGAVTANGPAAGDGYSLDLADTGLDRGNSTFDIRHRFVLNYVWDLPFGKGQQGLAAKILDGWQWNGLLAAQTGAHFTAYDNRAREFSAACTAIGFTDPGCVNTGGDYNLDGEGNDRPDPGPNFSNFDPTTDQWANGWFGTDPVSAGFLAIPCLGCNGSLGRNVLEGPGIFSFDMSVFKNVQVSEEVRVQFRFEVFNVFNRTNFLLPSNFSSAANRVASSNFGKAAGTLNPRQIQLGLKLLW